MGLAAVVALALDLAGAVEGVRAAETWNGPTTVAQLRALTRVQMNRGVPFSATGIITMMDTQRNVFVLQDHTNAMLVHPDAPVEAVPGTLVSVEAQRAAPYVINFPNFPFLPSGWNVETNFEGPTNWGDFHLTRMAGFLQPPVTGDYTFWIACDNSGELWLSTDDNPRRVRMVASIKTGYWVGLREWSRYPSQRSDPIRLEAGRSYYIEAVSEQVELDEHLAVAWEGPNLKQSVIEEQYLSPWRIPGRRGGSVTGTNGILREYWTNFTSGSLAAITAERPAESGVSAQGVQIRRLETNRWPEPVQIDLSGQLPPEKDHHWVETEGQVAFVAAENGGLTLELTADQNRALVRVAQWRGGLPVAGPNIVARVRGACEGAYGPSGALMPGTIWVVSDSDVKFLDEPSPNTPSVVASPIPVVATNNSLGGYFSARGVVTFNGRALGRDYLVVQDNNAGVFIVPPESPWAPAAPLLVGDSVDIGGHLLPSRFAARLRPRVANLVGQHTLPAPVVPAADSGPPRYRDGQWTELEGVARSVQPNGTLLLKRNDASVSLWVAGVETNALETMVDSTLRVRGVMSLDSPESPLLLMPSLGFVEVLQPARTNWQIEPISNLKAASTQTNPPHRVRVAGVITFCDGKLVFVQDGSGAVRVQLGRKSPVRPGDVVEVLGFPEPQFNSPPALMDARVHQLSAQARETSKLEVKPQRLDLNGPIRDLPNLSLVRVKAYLLGQKDFGNGQALEVQTGQRVWEALLTGEEKLPVLAPGSWLDLTGVCVLELVASTGAAHPGWESSAIGAARLLLRTPGDVVVLRGPPWWNWKKAVALITVLVILLTAALLRVHLLRRRFERQEAARLAFARQLLENQESERRRIAANLHDTLGQNLLAIKNQTHLAIQSSEDRALQKRLEDISGTVLNAIEEVRQITHDLRPYQLDRLGLSQSIRALVRKVAETCPIELASHVDDLDGRFPKESEINIYRIVQEGINNVVKHSQATEAAVVLKLESGALRISIRDNGRGLTPGQNIDEGSSGGFGLSGIRERARIMNGRVEVDSSPGQGFNLNVEIPGGASQRKVADHAIETEVAHS
jgi:signal transduction histidine kinase